jgi:surfeit locus 1 family protein
LTVSRRDLAFLIFSVLAFALLVWLGLWQVQRLQWKESLIARISEQGASEPLAVTEIEARHRAGENVEFLRAAASGRLLHDRELFVFATMDGQMGWKVVTPLETLDGNAVLVDRGFIPYELKEPGSRPGSRTAGIVTITGTVRPYSSARAPFAPDNEVDANVWHWWDLPAMAEAAGVERALPFVLQAEPRPGDTAWPRASRLDPASISNRHLGYALTWFGLAAMLLIVNGLYLFRRGPSLLPPKGRTGAG